MTTAADPFKTADLRRTVLEAWAASPSRFREDANAEEALAIGGYADRLLIELAANAVDAAAEAGRPGRVRFSVLESRGVAELRAANVGAPLTAPGVSGLASLRASAKRGRSATVGHFGVGFTAVLSVSDAPRVLSTTGGVEFSRSGTAAAIAALGIAELDAEVTARGGQVPVLRLPWPAESTGGPIPAGFDTEVRLPLRDGLLGGLIELLGSVGDDLLWALPGLLTVEIALPGLPVRVISRLDQADGITVIEHGRLGDGSVDDGVTDRAFSRYRAVTGRGTIPAELLADRPIEERDRNQWQLTWVLAESDAMTPMTSGFDLGSDAEPVFLGAPTPTDEPLSLPARLVGTFPVDDTRRRLAAGPLTAYLLGQAAQEYVRLFVATPRARQLALVPAAGFPAGPIDAELRERIIDRLSISPVVATVRGEPIVPSLACMIVEVSDRGAELLGRALPELLFSPRSAREAQAMRLLGVTTLPLADAVSALAGIDGSPSFWHRVYAELEDHNAEDLANLPVPLSGGGRRIGPTGALLPGADAVDADLLARVTKVAPDVRLVHPVAAHPLLARLGAVPADAASIVADPALGQRFHDFRQDLEDADPDPDELVELATVALELAATEGPGLLDDVVLTDADGVAWPASELLMPGAPLATVLAADADLPMVGAQWLGYPPQALARIGVRTGLKIVSVESADADLPDLDQWWSEVVGEGLPPEPFDAVADLDLVDDEKWPQLLAMIAADAKALLALTSGPDAADRRPSYTRWWLSRFALLAGYPPNHWRLPGAIELKGLYAEMPVTVEPGVAAAVGVLSSAADAVASDPSDFLRRLTDPQLTVPPGAVPGLTRLAADALGLDPRLELPAAVRTLSGAVVDADDALVLDLPWLAQVIDVGVLVAGGPYPARVAHLFDLELASHSTRAAVGGVALVPTADQLASAERAAFFLGFELETLFPSGSLLTVTDLEVSVGDGGAQRVSWWSTAGLTDRTDALITDGSAAGIGRAAAWKASRWADRHAAVAAAGSEPAELAETGLG